MTNAQRKRATAMGMLMELYVPASLDYEFRPDRTREEVAGNIRKLSQLGKTTRWHDAIERWARMVEDPRANLRWAFLQGSVYTTHAIN